jgi:hypothetical protein
MIMRSPLPGSRLNTLTTLFAISWILLHCLLAHGSQGATSQGPAEALTVTCSPEKPTVFLGDKVRLLAWAGPASQLQYKWIVSAGELVSQGADLQWSFARVKEGGIYEASVIVSNGTAASAKCTLKVAAQPRKREPPPIETGRSFLVKGTPETAGYGLYSYLLLGSPPTDAARDRFLGTVEAYLRTIQEIENLDSYFPCSKLNVTYLPVTGKPDTAPSSQWILDHYDYARARAVLDLLPGSHREGPYIVSLLRPAGQLQESLGPHLLQDLSAVPTKPPDLISWWVRAFMDQAAQEHSWNTLTMQSLVLKLRTTIAIVAVGLPDVGKSVGQWISWKSDSK